MASQVIGLKFPYKFAFWDIIITMLADFEHVGNGIQATVVTIYLFAERGNHDN